MISQRSLSETGGFGLFYNTPIEWHNGIAVKREDLCVPEPGPSFSKYRGVVPHIAARPEKIIGVLDTFHSKAGWAVAYACSLLDRKCVNFWPRYKAEGEFLRYNQRRSSALGAELIDLPAGRSSVLYHAARKGLPSGGYLMPNALKLSESVESNAAEAIATRTAEYRTVVLSVSSGTVASGVIRGILSKGESPNFVLHMGYSRPVHKISSYVRERSGGSPRLFYIDEKYEYKEPARAGSESPFPCNPYYDLKAWRWLLRQRAEIVEPILFWNIGA